jgi:hypothetical protein
VTTPSPGVDPTDIYVCGWRLRTGITLPSALPWPQTERRAADLVFAPGSVPTSLEKPILDLEVLQIGARGTALVRFPGIGRFLIRKRRVLTELEIGPEAAELTAVIFGNVAAAVCWRREQLALHGSAVAVDGRATLLLGRADTGKSLLAAALALRGHTLLGDELAAVSRRACFPAGSTLCLADDALVALGITRRGLPQSRRWRLAKRLWRAGPAAEPRPYSIGAVIVLRKGEPDGRSRMRRLEGDAAVDAVMDQVFRRGMLDILDSRRVALREARTLARAVPVFEFKVARDLAKIGAAAKAIETVTR